MTALAALVNEPEPRRHLTGVFEPDVGRIVADRSQELLVHFPAPVIE